MLEISELGLVEMTRKRVRQSLQSLFCAPCPACKGSGMIKSDATIAAEILRKMQAGVRDAAGTEVVVRVHPETAHHLEVDRRDAVERFQAMIGRKIVDPGGAVLSSRAVRRDVQVAADVTRSSRLSRAAILAELKLAARKGDRVALTLAIEQMKTLGLVAALLGKIPRSCSATRWRASST